jgi:hypothetical protein
MNAISRLVCVCALCLPVTSPLVCQRAAFGESRVQKPFEPKFCVGCPVRWSDGSRGVVVERPIYRDDEWYYLVQLGGKDGLCWTLPEAGLKFRENGE